MIKQSAGILLYKKSSQGLQVMIVHPGGPFWAKKDLNSWSIPKGELDEGEDMLAAAGREFNEEVGSPPPAGKAITLGSAKQPSGKIVYVWAIEADFDTTQTKSNLFEMEWPPKSGKTESFPEIDKVQWFTTTVAVTKLVKGQVIFLERLEQLVG